MFLITGDNWVVDGFKVRMNASRRFTHATSNTGVTFQNNRVEVKPGAQEYAFIVQTASNVTVKGNWAHHYPHCINGGETYAAGPWGDGGTAPACGTHSRCDFDTTNSSDIFNISGNGTGAADSNLVFEENDFGHWQNPVRIRNFTNVTVRRNKCTNATNHGCWEMDDVLGAVIENNIADIDTGPGCSDEILQSSLFDSYCFEDVVIRNNTVVGKGLGWQQQLAVLAPNPGADSRCNDGIAPEVADDGTEYDYFRVYNNIIYDGKPSGSYGVGLSTSNAAAEPSPCCHSDYNLIHRPSGGTVGSDGSTRYRTLAEWRSHGKDLNGTDAAPQFMNYSASDFRPLNVSAPQVNAGVNNASFPCPANDYFGNPRSDGRCDIGAIELQGGGTSDPSPGTVTNVNRTDVK
ncbi:MAG TPA: choice-of-anchor Q domain-containing protein [Candidatus Polarisedimenticolaceae bacterium]